jgi:hypothetical protein
MSVGLNSGSTAYVTSITPDDGTTWNVLDQGTTNPFRMLQVQMLDSAHGWAGCFSNDSLPIGTNGMDKYRGPKISNPAGIKSIVEVDNSLVYPDPSNGIINVHLSIAIAGTEVSIYDMLGNEVYKTTINTTVVNKSMSIDISTMQKGMYLLNIKCGNNNQVQKLIIQ